MPFNPPPIIGGGQIISPQRVGNPFQGINDAMGNLRKRQVQDKALMMESYGQWQSDIDNKRTDLPFDQWHQKTYPDSKQSQTSKGGFFDMLKKAGGNKPGEVASNISNAMKNFFDPGSQSSNKFGTRGGTGMDGPIYTTEGQKEREEELKNIGAPQHDIENISPYAPDTSPQEENEPWTGRPSPKLGPIERISNWFKGQKGFEGGGGGTGLDGPVHKTPEDEYSYKKQQYGATSSPQDPYGFGNKISKAEDIAASIDVQDAESVKKFQESVGLEADGVFGSDTEAALRAIQSGENVEPAKSYSSKYSKPPRITGYAFDRGGKVPGNRTGDKNKAYLEDGEYVLNRNAVEGMGKGFLDYINNERYPRFQSGGFNAPEIERGQIVRPDESAGANFGNALSSLAGAFSTGGSDPTMDYSSLKGSGYTPESYDALVKERQAAYTEPEEEGWQTGGHVQFMQPGGPVQDDDDDYYTGVPIIDERKYQQRLLRDQMKHGRDIEEHNIGIEEWQRGQERGPKAWARTAADYLMPDFIESPLLSYKYGTDVRNITDIPRAQADKAKADYARESARHGGYYDLPPEGISAMSPENFQLQQQFSGTPAPPTIQGLSNEALKKKARDSAGNFNAKEWLQTMYGDNFWSD